MVSSSQLSSMTGFARQEGEHADQQWVWELRSVNGRGLEMRFRLPYGFDDLELRLRKIVSAQLSRGSINIVLHMQQDTGNSRLSLNEQALDDVLSMLVTIEKKNPNLAASTAEGILSVRGVVESNEETLSDDSRKALVTALETSFGKGLSQLVDARRAEGVSLQEVLHKQIGEVEILTAKASEQAQTITEKLFKKLKDQVAELSDNINIDQDRLAQEVALLAVKADIREELDRLEAHIAAARELLKLKEPVGRKFDFLVQEFNREANTLCSKAASSDLKTTGLALKAVIDQIREQIQNVE